MIVCVCVCVRLLFHPAVLQRWRTLLWSNPSSSSEEEEEEEKQICCLNRTKRDQNTSEQNSRLWKKKKTWNDIAVFTRFNSSAPALKITL